MIPRPPSDKGDAKAADAKSDPIEEELNALHAQQLNEYLFSGNTSLTPLGPTPFCEWRLQELLSNGVKLQRNLAEKQCEEFLPHPSIVRVYETPHGFITLSLSQIRFWNKPKSNKDSPSLQQSHFLFDQKQNYDKTIFFYPLTGEHEGEAFFVAKLLSSEKPLLHILRMNLCTGKKTIINFIPDNDTLYPIGYFAPNKLVFFDEQNCEAHIGNFNFTTNQFAIELIHFLPDATTMRIWPGGHLWNVTCNDHLKIYKLSPDCTQLKLIFQGRDEIFDFVRFTKSTWADDKDFFDAAKGILQEYHIPHSVFNVIKIYAQCENTFFNRSLNTNVVRLHTFDSEWTYCRSSEVNFLNKLHVLQHDNREKDNQKIKTSELQKMLSEFKKDIAEKSTVHYYDLANTYLTRPELKKTWGFMQKTESEKEVIKVIKLLEEFKKLDDVFITRGVKWTSPSS